MRLRKAQRGQDSVTPLEMYQEQLRWEKRLKKWRYNRACINSRRKWDRKNLRTVSTHVEVEDAEKFRIICHRAGTTPYTALQQLIFMTNDTERLPVDLFPPRCSP